MCCQKIIYCKLTHYWLLVNITSLFLPHTFRYTNLVKWSVYKIYFRIISLPLFYLIGFILLEIKKKETKFKKFNKTQKRLKNYIKQTAFFKRTMWTSIKMVSDITDIFMGRIAVVAMKRVSNKTMVLFEMRTVRPVIFSCCYVKINLRCVNRKYQEVVNANKMSLKVYSSFVWTQSIYSKVH